MYEINAYVGGIVSLQLRASDKRDDAIAMVLWVVLGLLCLPYRPLLLTGTPCCASLRKRGIISCPVPRASSLSQQAGWPDDNPALTWRHMLSYLTGNTGCTFMPPALPPSLPGAKPPNPGRPRFVAPSLIVMMLHWTSNACCDWITTYYE